MPAFVPASILDTLQHDGGGVDVFSSSFLAPRGNDTDDALQVVCAWPLSGQYGPGSRVLYYVLVATCVFARKAEWLKNPCLAAALIFPAVAAIHGIVLAALHKEGAVDMDVFGAFQLCSIGILAAPVTVTLSRTYFQIRGRNTIFLWAGLILAGLLSLTIEFYRIGTTKCVHGPNGKPIVGHSQFPYQEGSMCGLICSVDEGPHSPMRTSSTNNIYVIPAPDKLTFGTATLLSAACCIHALIWLASMSDKILQTSWLNRFRDRDLEERIHEPIEGTNNATKAKMNNVNEMIKFFLSIAVIPVYSGAGLAILVIGERNFFSRQLTYQSEPIASIGQWAPIVGTCLALVGSLYLLLAADVEAVKEGVKLEGGSPHHCNCSNHHYDSGDHHSAVHSSIHIPPRDSADVRSHHSSDEYAVDEASPPENSIHLQRTMSRAYTELTRTGTVDEGGRRKVAEAFIKIGDVLGTAAQGWMDDTDFRRGRALDFPEVPGEMNRNPELSRIKEQYNPRRDSAGNVTPVPNDSRSRAASFISSIHSEAGPDSPVARRAPSPRLPASSSFPMRQRSNTDSIPIARTTSETLPLTPISSVPARSKPPRSNTLEVPSPVHHGHTRTQSASSVLRASSRSRSPGPSPPSIPRSSEAGPSTPKRSTSFEIPLTSSPIEETPPP